MDWEWKILTCITLVVQPIDKFIAHPLTLIVCYILISGQLLILCNNGFNCLVKFHNQISVFLY